MKKLKTAIEKMLRKSKFTQSTSKLVAKKKTKVTKSPAKVSVNVKNLLFHFQEMQELNVTNSIKDEPIEVSPQASNQDENDFESQIRSVAKRKHYTKIAAFNSLIELDEYIRAQNHYPINITHNTPVNCTFCVNHDKHKMSQIYRKCSCKKQNCNLAYRINNCKQEEYSQWTLAQTGIHPTEVDKEDEKGHGNDHNPPKSYGVALAVQQIFSEWLNQDAFITAKKLLIKLVNRRNENLRKPIVEQDKTYLFNKNLIPSLKQVL